MGAQQSTNEARQAPERKRCYYEVLGLDRRASEDEIKKAYRRKALELHPDRNYGNVDGATKLFAEVQSAYEVLSDPQERAWYDSHRDAILRGTSDENTDHYEHDVRVTSADEILAMFGRLHGRLDFTDSSTGFFAVLRESFGTLAREEVSTRRWQDLELVDYPSFGHATDDYDSVVRPFYAAWSGFATAKTFSWKDVYRYADAPDRRVRRMMEKENKRFREEGIREFNDAVRSLVAFVRKRDPRFVSSMQSEKDRQDALRRATAAQAARSRAANQAKVEAHVEPEWARSREPEELVGETQDSEEEDPTEELFECIVCEKSFKSENQYQAHERSKKHIKALHQLRRRMEKEDQHLVPEETHTSGTTHSQPASPEAVETEGPTHGVKANDMRSRDLFTPSNLDEASTSLAEDFTSFGGEDKAPQSVLSRPRSPSPIELVSEYDEEGDEDSDYAPRQTVESRVVGDDGSREDDITRLRSSPASDTVDLLSEGIRASAIEQGNAASAAPKVGKAKEKRAKKAAQQREAEKQGNEFKCAACHEAFPSKTKLFNHIKELDHAKPTKHPGKGQRTTKR